MYNDNLDNEDFSANFYDFFSALFIWLTGLFFICCFINNFQVIIHIKTLEIHKFKFILYPVWLLFIFPHLFINIFSYFKNKKEIIVVNNKINFLRKTSNRYIEYKSDDYFYYYLEFISIIMAFDSLIFLKLMESSIVLGYSVGMMCIVANINGESEISYFIKNMKRLLKGIY